jgi:hypothetical protein
MNMNPALLLFIILLFGVASSFLLMTKYVNGNLEGFKMFQNVLGDYPSSEEGGILKDVYPINDDKVIGDNTEHTIWKNYPIVEVGSYAQVTNNMRYQKSPDNGTCTPAEFCGSFYHDSHDTQSNIAKPFLPVLGLIRKLAHTVPCGLDT